jgi:hypothetical protein
MFLRRKRNFNGSFRFQKFSVHGVEHYMRGHQLFSHSTTSQHFTELHGTSPHSQELSTGLNPLRTKYPMSPRSILILSSRLRLGLPSGPFVLPNQAISYACSPSRYITCISQPPRSFNSDYTW